MPGELQLLLHREDADLDAALGFDRRVARDDECGLGKIGLAREGLHLCRSRDACRVGEDCQHVAFERCFGEDIDLGVLEGAQATWY
jgi:hypothetical protein